MPTIAWTPVPNALFSRDGVNDPPLSSAIANVSTDGLQVVCAWPVSGAYGPGQRMIYYVLVLIFVFSRKNQGLRDAALAIALLFPAVAACHAIVLAAVHVHGVVDMDIYGAFQACTIAVMASPLTVRLSRTYFSSRGITIIFLWTGLILSGLLSLTVEFYRTKSYSCRDEGSGMPTSFSAKQFPYSTNITCGLRCLVESSPRSPMRDGSSDNLYVIPAPDKLTFGTATILSAACCVPAFLSLISLGSRIIRIRAEATLNSRRDELDHEPIEGTNGATAAKMKAVNQLIKMFLVAVEIPVFAAMVIAIIVLGERNFFSAPVLHYTEPAASIGQWAPIITTIGSLYLILVVDVKETSEHHHHHYDAEDNPRDRPSVDNSAGSGSARSISAARPTPRTSVAMQEVGRQDMRRETSIIRPSNPFLSAASPTHLSANLQDNISMTSGGSRSRPKIAKFLYTLGNVGNSARDRLDDNAFKHGKARDFPEIPGEAQRNPGLVRIREKYSEHYRELQSRERYPPLEAPDAESRSGSFSGSIEPAVGNAGATKRFRKGTLEVPPATPSQAPQNDGDEIKPIEDGTPSYGAR